MLYFVCIFLSEYLSSGCYNNTIDWVAYITFVSRSLGNWEVQYQNASRFSVWREPTSQLVNTAFSLYPYIVWKERRGNNLSYITSLLINALIPSRGPHPYDLITSQRSHLKYHQIADQGFNTCGDTNTKSKTLSFSQVFTGFYFFLFFPTTWVQISASLFTSYATLPLYLFVPSFCPRFFTWKWRLLYRVAIKIKCL